MADRPPERHLVELELTYAQLLELRDAIEWTFDPEGLLERVLEDVREVVAQVEREQDAEWLPTVAAAMHAQSAAILRGASGG